MSLSLSIYIYIYVYMYICVYIYIYIYVLEPQIHMSPCRTKPAGSKTVFSPARHNYKPSLSQAKTRPVPRSSQADSQGL